MSDATPSTLYLVLGNPVHHSLSPALQNAAIRASGLDAVYSALCVPEQLLEPVMREVAAAGGGGNVTVPHKRAAAAALDEPTAAVRATGACNVFWRGQDLGLCGDNTDVVAFRAAAEALLRRGLRGARVLLLGAGGAARAVVHACDEAGTDAVDVLNRSRQKAERLLEDLGHPGGVQVLGSGVEEFGDRYDLIVNATSLGLHPADPPPLAVERLSAEAVLDLVYGREDTAFVRAARAAGMRAEDGRRMLVEQAAASFRIWFSSDAPRRLMFEALGMEGESMED